MTGLGEEVEGLNVLDFVAGLLECFEVSHLCGRFTGDVDAAAGGEAGELV